MCRQKGPRMRYVKTAFVLFIGLSACAETASNGNFLRELPEEVIARAAPNQNLNAVTILEEDGCFWYEHVGPVETTLLPLVSTRGRHLCTVRDEAEAA